VSDSATGAGSSGRVWVGPRPRFWGRGPPAGLAWTADGFTAYYVDTPTQRIDVFDFDPDTALLRNRRPVVTIDPAAGSPDGLTLDAEGGIWVVEAFRIRSD
jgi:sugar lactone lactonase YvrE